MDITKKYLFFLFWSILAILIFAALLELFVTNDLAEDPEGVVFTEAYLGLPAILTSIFFGAKDIRQQYSTSKVVIRFIVSYSTSLPVTYLLGVLLTGDQAFRQLSMDQTGQNTIGAAVVMLFTVLFGVPILTTVFYSLSRKIIKK